MSEECGAEKPKTFTSVLKFLPYFSRTVLRAVSQLTERLEQGNLITARLFIRKRANVCLIGGFAGEPPRGGG